MSKYSQRKTIYLVTQFNHPHEIANEYTRTIQTMINREIQVCNQTILLRRVYDVPQTLNQLLSALTRIKVNLYSIFQCHPVTGIKRRFQVPINEEIQIVDKAKSYQNSFDKSVRYVMSHPLD